MREHFSWLWPRRYAAPHGSPEPGYRDRAPVAQRGPMHTPAARAHALRASGVTYPGGVEHVSAVRADLHGLLHGCPADDVIV